MSRFNLTFLLIAPLFFLSCGGSSSSNNIADKKYLIVIKDVPKGICESKKYKDYIKSHTDVEGLMTKETSGDTSCETYGRVNDGETCDEEYYTDIGSTEGTNCVVGVDKINNYAPTTSNRLIDNSRYLKDVANKINNSLGL